MLSVVRCALSFLAEPRSRSDPNRAPQSARAAVLFAWRRTRLLRSHDNLDSHITIPLSVLLCCLLCAAPSHFWPSRAPGPILTGRHSRHAPQSYSHGAALGCCGAMITWTHISLYLCLCCYAVCCALRPLISGRAALPVRS